MENPTPVVHHPIAMVDVGGVEHVAPFVVLVDDTFTSGGAFFVLEVFGSRYHLFAGRGHVLRPGKRERTVSGLELLPTN